MERPNGDEVALPELLAPPRKNGELQFDAPWESRIFGLAVMLERRQVCSWEELGARLAARAARSSVPESPPGGQSPLDDSPQDPSVARGSVPEAPPGGQSPLDDAPEAYYRQWLAALETLPIEKGAIRPEELGARAAELASDDPAHAIATTAGG